MTRTTLQDDWDEFSLGEYQVVNNVWNRGSLIDYTQSVTFDPSDLTRDVVFSWDWGAGRNGDVLAYPEIVVGYKPWNEAVALADRSTVMDARISDIRSFDLQHDITLGGDTGKFNASYDLWLTDTAMGDAASITTELMIWTHAYDFTMDPQSIVGQFSANGAKYTIITYADFGGDINDAGNTWRYIALIPDHDVLSADIDVRAILTRLIDEGLVSEQDFVTGYEFGAEVTGGSGSLTVNSLSYDFDTFGADDTANKLSGTSGRDRIFGLGGGDTIRGLAGNDLLSGGAGRDTLTGGIGKDTFDFRDLRGKADVISDFAGDRDTIALESSVFTALDAGDLAADAFKIGGAFSADTRLLYLRSSGKLFYDADGSASGDDAHLVAILKNHAKLDISDFTVL